MTLHHDWRNILMQAWSVRLMLLSAVFGGGASGLTLAQPYLSANPILIAVLVGLLTTGASLLSIAGIYARIVKQRGLG